MSPYKIICVSRKAKGIESMANDILLLTKFLEIEYFEILSEILLVLMIWILAPIDFTSFSKTILERATQFQSREHWQENVWSIALTSFCTIQGLKHSYQSTTSQSQHQARLEDPNFFQLDLKQTFPKLC